MMSRTIRFSLLVLLSLISFSSLQAADIYVDAAKGNDANPGTKDKPLKTFVKAIDSAKGGDNILLQPGEYEGLKRRLGPGKKLFEEQLVTVCPAAGEGEEARKAVKLGRISLGVRGSQFAGKDGKGSYPVFLRFKNLTLTDGVYCFGGKNLEVVDCLVRRIGPWTGSEENIEKVAVEFLSGSKMTIRGCDITETGVGINMTGYESKAIGNHIHDITHDGIRATGMKNGVIENNHIHNLDDGVEDSDKKKWNRHCDGIHIFVPGPGNPGQENIGLVVRGNRIYDCESQGIIFSIYLRKPNLHNKDILVENNIFGPTRALAVNIPGGVDDLIFRHNSFIPGKRTFKSRFREITCQNTRFRITGGCKRAQVYNNIFCNSFPTSPDWFVGYNLQIAPDKNSRLLRGDMSAENGEAAFADAPKMDGVLAKNSPAINAGTRVWCPEKPAPLKTDIVGTPRDLRPDCGAWELPKQTPLAEKPRPTLIGPAKIFIDDFADGNLSADPVLTGRRQRGLSWVRPDGQKASWWVGRLGKPNELGMTMQSQKGESLMLTEDGKDWGDLKATWTMQNCYNNVSGGLLLHANQAGEGYLVDVIAGKIILRKKDTDGKMTSNVLAKKTPMLINRNRGAFIAEIRTTPDGKVTISAKTAGAKDWTLTATDEKGAFKTGRAGVLGVSVNGSHRTDLGSVKIELINKAE